MPATKADKKSSSSKKKDKSKGEASSKSSKDKPRRSKDKASSKAPSSGAEAAAAPPPPAADPDAVQLFRRYDRSRAGFLTRVDFLQLVRDYASAPNGAALSSAAYGRWASRAPLSLTDSRGVPLGYARADRNSEFEAGQLFERYDSDRSGALSLDKFLRFFADFQPQLAAFVQDCAYFGASVAPVAPIASHEQAATTSQPEATDGRPSPTPEQVRTRVCDSLFIRIVSSLDHVFCRLEPTASADDWRQERRRRRTHDSQRGGKRQARVPGGALGAAQAVQRRARQPARAARPKGRTTRQLGRLWGSTCEKLTRRRHVCVCREDGGASERDGAATAASAVGRQRRSSRAGCKADGAVHAAAWPSKRGVWR